MFSKKRNYITCSHRCVVSNYSLPKMILFNFEFVTFWVTILTILQSLRNISYITLNKRGRRKQNKQNLSFPKLVYGLTRQVSVTSTWSLPFPPWLHSPHVNCCYTSLSLHSRAHGRQFRLLTREAVCVMVKNTSSRVRIPGFKFWP